MKDTVSPSIMDRIRGLFGRRQKRRRRRTVSVTSRTSRSYLGDLSRDTSVSSSVSDMYKVRPDKASIRSLFSYGTSGDYGLFCAGLLFAFLNGLGPAVYAIATGEVVTYFILVDRKSSEFHEVTIWIGLMILLGCLMTICAFFQHYCLKAVAARVIRRIRCAYLKSLLHQEIAFFVHNHAELSNNVEKISGGLGDKVGSFLRSVVQFISCIFVAFYFCWELALLLSVVIPFLIIWSECLSAPMDAAASQQAKAAERSREYVVEVLGAVQTVQAFNAQQYELNRYNTRLEAAVRHARRKNLYTGIFTAMSQASLYLYLFAGTMYGAMLYDEETVFYPGDLFVVLASVAAGAYITPSIRPLFSDIIKALNAAGIVNTVISRIPEIDSSVEHGKSLNDVKGEIEFSDVWLKNPLQTEGNLNGVTFRIRRGETVAILGVDDSRQSLCADILNCFYDVDRGTIKIDGTDIHLLNVPQLRSIIGTIENEPELFNDSVENNIKMGNPHMTRNDVVQYCQEAGIHEFIETLPKGYDTFIDDNSGMLNAEQRQRIGLARTLARNPQILIFKETWDAYRHIVQASEKPQTRTIILITRRAIAAKDADRVLVMFHGRIAEEGTHDELMEKESHYAKAFEAEKIDVPEDSEIEAVEEALSSPEPAFKKKLLTAFMKEFSHTEKYHAPYQQKEVHSVRKSYTYVDLVKCALHHRKLYMIAVVCCFIYSFGVPLYTKCNGDYFAIYETPRDKADSYVTMALDVAIYYLILGAVCNISLAIYIRLFGDIGESLVTRLRLSTFSYILHQDGAFFDTRDPDQHNDLLIKDAMACRAAFDLRFGQFLNAIFQLLIAYATSAQKNIMMGSLASLCFVVQPVVQFLIARLTHTYRRKAAENDNTGEIRRCQRIAMEAIERLKTVQYLNCQQLFCDKFEAASQKQLDVDLRTLILQSLTHASTNGFQQFVTAIAYLIGYVMVQLNFVTAPLMVHRIIQTLLPSAANAPFIANYIPEFDKSRVAANRVMPLVREQEAAEKSLDAGEPVEIQGKVELKDVSFAYPSRADRPVFQDVSLFIEFDKTVAIVSPPRSGKSTLFALIERFYHPTSGKILIDDHDINLMPLRHLRSKLGLVSRDAALFAGSIRDNIAYGLRVPEDVTMEDVIAAAKMANTDTLIAQFPQGYDTPVGVYGSRLSSGQRQRVALARAFLRNPRILLVDIASRDMDEVSEQAISDAIDKARHGRTCIVLARQVPIVKNVDEIVGFENGRVVKELSQTAFQKQYQRHHRTSRPLFVPRMALWDPPATPIGLI